MSRLIVPIQGRVLYATGDVMLHADLRLLLKTNAGGWKRETFLVDSGTEITTFPAALARSLGLPMPLKTSPGSVHAQTGLEIRSGFLRFQVVGMDATEYALACFFLGDPNTPPAVPHATQPRKLLQPLGLVDWLRFSFDKEPGMSTPHGEMIVEKK